MATILTTPIIVPEKHITVQKIDGVYIDYATRSVTISVGDYESMDSGDPINVVGHGFPLDDFISGENLLHFKHFFRAIRLKAREVGIIGDGVEQ